MNFKILGSLLLLACLTELASSQSSPQRVCLTLTPGKAEWKINLEINQAVIESGSIATGICGAPWDVQPGGELGPKVNDRLTLEAHPAVLEECAAMLTMTGRRLPNDEIKGTYRFDKEKPYTFTAKVKSGTC